ncbi:MAG TPA: glycosyltransferase family 4 protein [Anaerolineales bacterium]|nr:glycosyltransferase family 4 protein [Anaerolineales bacterium]HLO31256.1 glycosyltransferase family 4 protein [Anaerolineales bacterium]
MKIYIVSCVFLPEPVVSARTSAHIAEKMSGLGHQVKVFAPLPSRPAGHDYSQFGYSLMRSKTSPHGYKIIRCLSFFSAVSTLASRFLENISFGLSVFFILVFSPRADVVYGNTWPIFAQGLLMLVCKLRHMPLVLSVQDLYPESLLAQKRGIKKNSFLYSLLHWLDVQITRNCAGLIVISERFKEAYVNDRRISEDKITVIPNWIDDSQAVTTSPRDDIRKKHNVPTDAFLVIYGGNIGMAAGIENLIEAFQHLLAQENIYLLLAGAGSSLPDCLDLIRKRQLERVKIHSPWQVSDTYPLLSAADLCILPTQGEQSLVSVPSKLLSYMLAGRCILALATPGSETARILLDSQAGWVISTNDSISLANSISKISRLSSAERDRPGEAGRNFVLKHFSISQNLPKVVEFLVRKGKCSEQNSSYAIQ